MALLARIACAVALVALVWLGAWFVVSIGQKDAGEYFAAVATVLAIRVAMPPNAEG